MEYLDASPMSSAQIRKWTEQDPLLSKVKTWTLTGWPSHQSHVEEELKPFVRRRYELSVEGGCVLWGSRVVVPTRGRDVVLKMLHEAHPGINQMKGLAHSYVWWPGIDDELEKMCQIVRSMSTTPKSSTSSSNARLVLAY